MKIFEKKQREFAPVLIEIETLDELELLKKFFGGISYSKISEILGKADDSVTEIHELTKQIYNKLDKLPSINY